MKHTTLGNNIQSTEGSINHKVLQTSSLFCPLRKGHLLLEKWRDHEWKRETKFQTRSIPRLCLPNRAAFQLDDPLTGHRHLALHGSDNTRKEPIGLPQTYCQQRRESMVLPSREQAQQLLDVLLVFPMEKGDGKKDEVISQTLLFISGEVFDFVSDLS